jgi:NADH dehydrogenase FAD-containing subunit
VEVLVVKIRTKKDQKKESIQVSEFKIDFSFRREVFFIISGAFVGAIAYVIPITIFAIEQGSLYYLTWIVFGHIVGIYSPITSVIIVGFLLHVLTATCIGIIAGLFLYKTNILNISKPSNGLKYGLFVGFSVFVIFAIPVQEFVLGPEFARTIDNGSKGTRADILPPFSNQIITTQLRALANSLVINLVFGITLGLFSSFLSIKFGARYRCPRCDISFARVDSLQHHLEFIHGSKPILSKKVLILGGGFAGVEVLRRLQSRFQNDVSVDITMVSKDNFFLFTPMLHEVACGTIETRDIVTPIRAFCNRAKFYAARVESIDLKNREVIIGSSAVGRNITTTNNITAKMNESSIVPPPLLSEVKEVKDSLAYEYLVIALGAETRFFGLTDVEKNAFTIKSWNDAIAIRNHIIHQLEQAELLLRQNYEGSDPDREKKDSLLTFVIVGGGFAGVETAGELNDFVRESVDDYYHNIEIKDIHVLVIQSGKRLLPEMSNELAEFARRKLIQTGVEVILNSRVIGATANSVKLNDGRTISTNTIIWSGGISPSNIAAGLPCERDKKSGRILVNRYLEVESFPGVFALGDCAFIIDPNTGDPYPPTAQHAIREGTVVASNIISLIEGKADCKKVFDYKTKGMMATIGKRNGVGKILGLEVQGFMAWWIWRMYYLVNLPTLQKKLRVMADWTLDIFFKRDVTMLKTIVEEREERIAEGAAER